jgi:hypothetical protein
MIEMDCTYYLSYHNLVPSTGNLHYWYSRRLRRFGLVAGAPSGRCGHARAWIQKWLKIRWDFYKALDIIVFQGGDDGRGYSYRNRNMFKIPR